MFRAGHIIALCVMSLLTLGVVMVNSAVMSVSRVPQGAPGAELLDATDVIFSRQTLYMVMAIVALGVGSIVPVRRLVSKMPGPFTSNDSLGGLGLLSAVGLVLLVTCALVYVPGVGVKLNGASRWIHLPVPGLGDAQSVQPSEIAKWAMIPLVAWYCWARASVLHEFIRGLVPILMCAGLVGGFVVLEDLGTGVLISGVACLVLLAAGARIWQFALCAPPALLLVGAAIFTSDYRRKRILAFLDPFEDPRGIGYHTVQSLVSVSSGNGWGRGLGHGLNKFGYLPEDKNDFIFAVICEEMGIAGATLVCALFAALLYFGISIARREKHPMLRLWAFGVPTMIACQALINLAVVTGLAPTKGIALPMLSAGGTGWILTAFSVGLIISIERTQRNESPFADSPLQPAPLPPVSHA